MENKKQDIKSLVEFKKAVVEFGNKVNDFVEIFSKLLPDVESSNEEDTWEMKCPYDYSDKVYILDSEGYVYGNNWSCKAWELNVFNHGNIFLTRQAAELEAKRRNLLTRFNAFRDECNGDWKPDWKNAYGNKYFICEVASGLEVYVSSIGNSFVTFGYFKNNEDCKRAIELFEDEIKELFVECD